MGTNAVMVFGGLAVGVLIGVSMERTRYSFFEWRSAIRKVTIMRAATARHAFTTALLLALVVGVVYATHGTFS